MPKNSPQLSKNTAHRPVRSAVCAGHGAFLHRGHIGHPRAFARHEAGSGEYCGDVCPVLHGAKTGLCAGCAEGVLRLSGLRLDGRFSFPLRRSALAAGDVAALLSLPAAAHMVHPVSLRRAGPQHRPAAGRQCHPFHSSVPLLCTDYAGAGPCDGNAHQYHPAGYAACAGTAGL